MTSKAIVAAAEQSLAKPAKPLKDILPKKRRCRILVKKNDTTFRKDGACYIELKEGLEADLSEASIADKTNLLRYRIDEQTVGMVFGIINLTVSMLIFGDNPAPSLWAIMTLVPMPFITGVTAAGLWYKLRRRLLRRRKQRVVTDRLTEKEQILEGIERLKQLAYGQPADCQNIPLESLFLALGEDDPLLAQLAAKLVSKLPHHLHLQALKHYKHDLSEKALRNLHDMNWLTPGLSWATGMGKVDVKSEPYQAKDWQLCAPDAPPEKQLTDGQKNPAPPGDPIPITE